VVYTSTLTSSVESISPRYGTVEGGTVVTFSGSNFPTDTGLYTIKIDDKDCTINSATTTEVVCTTAPRPDYYPSTNLEFYITG